MNMKRLGVLISLMLTQVSCGPTPTDLSLTGVDTLEGYQFEKALEYFDEALRLKPDHENSRLYRICAYIGLGRHATAQTEIAALGDHPSYYTIIWSGYLMHHNLKGLEIYYSDQLMAKAWVRQALDLRCEAYFDRAFIAFEWARRFDEEVTDIDFQIAMLLAEKYPATATYYLERGDLSQKHWTTFLENHRDFDHLKGHEPFDQLLEQIFDGAPLPAAFVQ